VSDAENSEAPHLNVSGSLSVHPGTSNSIPMGITATPVDSDDTVSITISGVPKYETISLSSAGVSAGESVTSVTHKGLTTYTITAPPGASISGSDLTLTSTYKGRKPVTNTFSVTASNTTTGETATSPPVSVTVTDPPILTTNQTNGVPPSNPPNLDQQVALFNQYMAAGFPEQQGGQVTTNASENTTNEQQFLANPHHG
jgi:hypothetical protein